MKRRANHKKKIPLRTRYVYRIDKFGNVYRDGKRLHGYLHESRFNTGKMYRRYQLIMEDGTPKKFYAHRLMGYTYLGLKEGDGMLVLHDTPDGTYNYVLNLRLGTMQENQTVDRMEAGNYHNRGKYKSNY